MRHTLLPLNERKTLRREYFLRLLIVLFFMISTACLIGAIALLPAYLHSRDLAQSELDLANRTLDSKDAQGRTQIDMELKNSANLVSKLDSEAKEYKASQAIEQIIALRGLTKLITITFEQQGTSTIQIGMQGTSPTRTELLDFKSRITNAYPQAKIDLPIGELAKSKNIDFSMRLTYKTK